MRMQVVANPETQSVICSLDYGAGPHLWDSCIVMSIDNWECDDAPVSKIDDRWVASNDNYEILWMIPWLSR